MKLPSRYVLTRTAIVTLLAATISISVSTGIRWMIGASADTITIIVRIILPFVIAIPIALFWFSNLEKLQKAHRALLKQAGELSRRANTDPLTGLLNRRSFSEEFDRTMGLGISGVFIIADVDYLKAINDEFGHLVGDDAILATSAALQAVLGEESLIARIGGDEFCAFIPLARTSDLNHMLAEIDRLAGQEFRRRSGLDEPTLSISIGYQKCRHVTTFRDIMARTDSDLYRKKRDRKADEPFGTVQGTG